MRFSRTTNRYQPDETRDDAVIEAQLDLAQRYPVYGFKMMYDKLRQDGKLWNHKRVYRVYKLLKLNLRRKCKKRLPSRKPQPLTVPLLGQIEQSRGFPEKIRMDNGPEFISIALALWVEANGVFLEFIEPGKPTQNSFIERFNRKFRTEVLDHYLFRSINEVREITRNRIDEYNNARPHQSLNGMAPVAYLRQKQIGDSNLGWY